jgi:hypothetical protein
MRLAVTIGAPCMQVVLRIIRIPTIVGKLVRIAMGWTIHSLANIMLNPIKVAMTNGAPRLDSESLDNLHTGLLLNHVNIIIIIGELHNLY